MKQPGKQPKNQPTQAAFVYVSTCCNVQATKEPCERTPDDRKSGAFSQSPLGTWHCGKCSKKCKVTRHTDKVS